MTTIKVKADNLISEDSRARTLQYLQDNLSDLELERLGQISKSTKAKNYLNKEYHMVKFFFGIK